MSKRASLLSLSVVFALVAYYYKSYREDPLRDRLNDVLSGLLRAERKIQPAGPSKVAVGFGACMDGFVNATEILQQLGAKPPLIPKHYNTISTVDELREVFAYFFQHGAAGERFVSNQTLFRKVVDLTEAMGARWEIGGNAPVMANRFEKEGCQVLLGARASKRVLPLLRDNVQAVGGHDSSVGDDLHILMEYRLGDTFGKYTSPRANRFIVHSDRSNPTIDALEDFGEALQSFGPDLLVVGGLQMMDQFPFKTGEREARLSRLEDLLKSVPKKTKIHFEMASFSEQQLLEDLVHTVVPYSDSLGMNEQELPNLYSVLSNGSITLISDAYPRAATVLDHTRSVYEILHQRARRANQRPVSRIHVHTLAYQVILVRTGSGWKNTMSSAAKASLTANRHVCGSNWIDPEKARLIMDDSFTTTRGGPDSRRIAVESDRPVSCWTEADYEICLAPNLVCTEVYQTAGGGDNISSAGLVLQI